MNQNIREVSCLNLRPPTFLCCVCVHNWSSAPVYYCEHKRKLKGREAWEQGQCDILVGVILNINTPQDGGFRGSNEDQIKFIFISTMVHLPF